MDRRVNPNRAPTPTARAAARIATDADWHRLFADYRAFARVARPFALTGRLTRVAGLVMEASGLRLPVGSVCSVTPEGAAPLEAEVVGFADDRLFLMPLADTIGLRRTFCGSSPPSQERSRSVV